MKPPKTTARLKAPKNKALEVSPWTTFFGSTTQGWESAWWASPGADASSRENGGSQAQGSPKPGNGHPKTITLSFCFPSQCAPGIFNLDQKFHGVSCFWGLYIHEIVQNQSRKTSVIGLPKFTIVKLARKSTHHFYHGKLVFWGLFFWKPNDRCFSWLILNYLMYIKAKKARKSMELLV